MAAGVVVNNKLNVTSYSRCKMKSTKVLVRPKLLPWSCLTAVLLFASFASETLALECLCTNNCPDGQHNTTCQVDGTSAMCFAHVEEVYDEHNGKYEADYTYGCLHDETALLTCKGHLTPHKTPMNIACCNQHMCNANLKPLLAPREITEVETLDDQTHLVLFLLSLSMCAIVATTIAVFIYRRRRKRLESSSENEAFLPGGSKSLQDLIDCSITSGSGSGLPRMVQRTIARQIEFVKSIGKGRYGEVFQATWKGEFVACKVFYSTEEASWCRETDIYQTNLLRHDHILGFVASDIRGTGGWTQLLLITNYHENGSLFDYLTRTPLDDDGALEMAYSACSGLCHLHTEIFGKQAKPAIAHRDIKSKNILVKRDGTCCIADFGLAVCFTAGSNQLDVGAQNTRVGTKRYMAPEVLDETLNTNNFNSYRQADMYSFGLVLWEITSRIVINGKVEAYRIPFHDSVPNDPSFDEMKKVVSISGLRPDVPETWATNETAKAMSQILQECWQHNPASRLTALRVKKSLAKIEDQMSKRYSSEENAVPV